MYWYHLFTLSCVYSCQTLIIQLEIGSPVGPALLEFVPFTVLIDGINSFVCVFINCI